MPINPVFSAHGKRTCLARDDRFLSTCSTSRQLRLESSSDQSLASNELGSAPIPTVLWLWFEAARQMDHTRQPKHRLVLCRHALAESGHTPARFYFCPRVNSAKRQMDRPCSLSAASLVSWHDHRLSFPVDGNGENLLLRWNSSPVTKA